MAYRLLVGPHPGRWAAPTPCADYSYDSLTDTETFRLLDSRTNRSEIRLQNDYQVGRRQFEGYVTFFSPLDDESLFQIFGSTSGATLRMMRGYNDNGGKIRVVGGIGDLVTGVYGVEKCASTSFTTSRTSSSSMSTASSKASSARPRTRKLLEIWRVRHRPRPRLRARRREMAIRAAPSATACRQAGTRRRRHSSKPKPPC